MGLDLDALVLGPNIAIWGNEAILTPVVSQPGAAAYVIRGIFALKGADIQADDGSIVRADNYTFGVRASEFPILPARGDLVSEIVHRSFVRFLAGRIFAIDDTGDDGEGGQGWVLKEVIEPDDA